MTSLLGINFGGGPNRQAHFQTRIIIHELSNVPMVAGEFKAKWRIDHTHHISSSSTKEALLGGANSATIPNDEHPSQSLQTASSEHSRLHHKKSTSTLASQINVNDDTTGGSSTYNVNTVDTNPPQRLSRDDASSTYSNSGIGSAGGSAKFSRKNATNGAGTKFLSSLRDAFQANSSSSNSREKSSPSFSARPSTDDGGQSRTNSDEEMHQQQQQQQQDNTAKASSSSEAEHYQKSISRREGSTTSEYSPNLSSYEPKGETIGAHVRDHRVTWERPINVGVRLNLEKARVPSGGSEASSSRTSRLLEGTEGSGTLSTRDSAQVNFPSSATSSLAWGQLGQAELRVFVKAEVPTGTSDSHHSHARSAVRLGNVAINLAEFAPVPHHSHKHSKHHHHHFVSGGPQSGLARRSSQQSSHSEHHKQSEHHNKQSEHHNTTASSNSATSPHSHNNGILYRSETRRYLLQDGQTNATIKLTVEMTHVGGSREYTVPPNKRGLLVSSSTDPRDNKHHAAAAAEADWSSSLSHVKREIDDEKSKIPELGSSSSHENAEEEGDDETSSTKADAGANASAVVPSSTKISSAITSGAVKAFDRNPNSVARHSRIPDSNLHTSLSHKDTARAVKEAGAGGGRLAFSFAAAGAHHDRPPEDVIEAMFSAVPKKSRSRTISSSANHRIFVQP